MSCSQNCENCGPIVGFYSIMAGASVSPGGWGCLNGDPLPGNILAYQNYTSQAESEGQAKYDYEAKYTSTNPEDPYDFDSTSTTKTNSRAKYESSFNLSIVGNIDKYGNYFEINKGNSSTNATYTSNGSYNTGPMLCNAYSENSSANSSAVITCRLVECSSDPCQPIVPCNYWDCNEDCKNKSNFSVRNNGGRVQNCGEPNPASDSSEYTSYDCQAGSFPGCNGQTTTNCTTQVCTYSDTTIENTIDSSPPFTSQGTTTNTSSVNTTTSIGSPANLQTAKGFSIRCADTKIKIYETNQDQDCDGTRCGGDKDDCWGGGFGFSVVGNSETSYYARAKVKVAVSKEAMEPYSSIGGKVYFYQDSVPDCCGEGSPIINTDFTLSSSANFKNNTLCATSVYNFDNDQMQQYAGSTIGGCVKVTKVSYR